ncbi:hypothetical protein C8J57DRAFT_1250102 [Mycena rebaudengoi]|nr:hypothetical protein C8J57DRAFT_1250102 [Mycena rebaudengoi]
MYVVTDHIQIYHYLLLYHRHALTSVTLATPSYRSARVEALLAAKEYPPLERKPRSTVSSPTKVDILGTTEILAGRDRTVGDDAHRPRSVPSISGLAPPRPLSASQVAFGSKIPVASKARSAFQPQSASQISLRRHLEHGSSPSYSSRTPSSTVLSLRGFSVNPISSTSTSRNPRVSIIPPSSGDKSTIVMFHRRRSLSPISEWISVDGIIISANSLMSFDAQQSKSMDGTQENLMSSGNLMTELQEEYYRTGTGLEDEDESMQQRVLLLSLKVLEQADITDRGTSNRYLSRYSVWSELLNQARSVCSDLQKFLKVASELVPDRDKFFQVDPGGSLLSICRNSSDIPQLKVAWDIFRQRIVLGQKFFDKYAVEFHEATELQEGLEAMSSHDRKLRHMIAYYPHHQDVEAGSSPSRRLHLLSNNWDNVEGPTSVQDNSARVELVPSGNLSNVTMCGGQRRESGMDMNNNSGAQQSFFLNPVTESSLNKMVPATYPSPSKMVTHPPNTSVFMSAGIPFKSERNFLDQMAKESSIAVESVPTQPITPNILDNLAAGPMGSRGDLFQATFGAASLVKCQRGLKQFRTYVAPHLRSNVSASFSRPLSSGLILTREVPLLGKLKIPGKCSVVQKVGGPVEQVRVIVSAFKFTAWGVGRRESKIETWGHAVGQMSNFVHPTGSVLVTMDHADLGDLAKRVVNATHVDILIVLPCDFLDNPSPYKASMTFQVLFGWMTIGVLQFVLVALRVRGYSNGYRTEFGGGAQEVYKTRCRLTGYGITTGQHWVISILVVGLEGRIVGKALAERF